MSHIDSRNIQKSAPNGALHWLDKRLSLNRYTAWNRLDQRHHGLGQEYQHHHHGFYTHYRLHK